MKLFNVFVTVALGCASLGLASMSTADDNDAGWKKKRIAVHLLGTGYVQERLVPDIDGDGLPDMARCYDVKLLDIETDKQVGLGTDCIANVIPVGAGLQLDATYYLHLDNGSIVVRGRNTAQPVLRKTVSTIDGTPYTHSVAASGDWNAKLDGTGVYAIGGARLRASGLMNISNVKGTPQDSVFLDVLLLVELDRQR